MFAIRRRSRANWRKAGTKSLPCKSLTLVQMAAEAAAVAAAK